MAMVEFGALCQRPFARPIAQAAGKNELPCIVSLHFHSINQACAMTAWPGMFDSLGKSPLVVR